MRESVGQVTATARSHRPFTQISATVVWETFSLQFASPLNECRLLLSNFIFFTQVSNLLFSVLSIFVTIMDGKNDTNQPIF